MLQQLTDRFFLQHRPKNCFLDPTGGSKHTLTIPINECGTKIDKDGYHTNTVILQVIYSSVHTNIKMTPEPETIKLKDTAKPDTATIFVLRFISRPSILMHLPSPVYSVYFSREMIFLNYPSVFERPANFHMGQVDKKFAI